ncbi:hypothetical protein [Sorangium cellulosum]|uniref:hypothetical protein n=1 Tax=Sorangium TaxID=39643 RepID=UPI001F45E950|nr:hypothetical protein [Sorangium cellulosum]
MSAMSARNTGTGGAAPRRPRALAAACLAAAAALLSPRGAEAAAPRAAVRLEYRRAPGAERCPDEGLLREEMARQLGYDPVEPAAALQARTLIFRGPGREMHATMELHDADGAVTWSRHLVAYNDDCGELVMNMALSLRVALDPSLRVQPAPDPPPPAPAPAPPIEAAVELPARPAGPELRVGLTGAAVFGLLQDTSPGTVLHAALRYPSFSLGLEGLVHWPAVMSVDRGTVSTWLAAVSAVPCSQVRYLFACAFVSLGVATTAARGVSLDETSTLWLATGPRAGVELPFSDWLAVQIYGDIVLRLSELRVESSTAVLWVPPSAGGLVGLRIDFGLAAGLGAPARRALLGRGPWARH